MWKMRRSISSRWFGAISNEWALAALLALTGPGGQAIDINPRKIISLRDPRPQGHVAKDVRCLISTEDGKFIGVIETCDVVLSKYNQGEKY